MVDGRMAGEMLCTDPRTGGQWTARLQGGYGPQDYALDLVVEMPSPFDPGQLAITSRVSGRRLGACPAAEKSEQGRQQ